MNIPDHIRLCVIVPTYNNAGTIAKVVSDVSAHCSDIIVVNEALVSAKRGALGLIPIVKNKYYGRVFHKPFMTQQEGQYKGTPFRTSSGGAFIGGYSDHYPTYIVVSTKH